MTAVAFLHSCSILNIGEIMMKTMIFPMDTVIARYVRDEKITEEAAREHERELKRYLVLCAAYPEESLGMKGPADNLWHTFIMYTKEYARFCREIAGRFIHHSPSSEEDKRSGKAHADYARFLMLYQKHFGGPPMHIWPQMPSMLPVGADADCSNSCGCSPGGSCDGASCGDTQ